MRLLIALALLVAGLLSGFFWFTATLPRAPEQPTRHTDAIVVLTGGADRLQEGVRLLAQDRGDRLLISGVHRDVTVAQLLAQVPEAPIGLAERITLDYAAGDTFGNARETAAWMRQQGFDTLRLVTAGYHMPRSLLELRRVLPDVEILAHPVFPAAVQQERWWTSADSVNVLMGEYLKYLGALLTSPFRS